MDDLKVLTDLQPTSKDGKSIIPALVSMLQSFQQKFVDMFTELKDEFVDLCKTKDVKIGELHGEIKSLKLQVSKLEDRIDQNESYERRDTLVFSGKVIPVVKADENCAELVCKLLLDNLRLVVSPNDISIAHRLGPKPTNQTPDRRNVIVKFCKRNAKIDILSSARRAKPKDFYVNESLTPLRQSSAYAIRKAKIEFPTIVSGYNTIDGSISVWVKSVNQNAPGARDSRITINSYDRLRDFCEKTLGKPISHFIQTLRV